jgi:hypothetical protein
MALRTSCLKAALIVTALLLTTCVTIAQELETKKSFEGVMEVQVQNTERVQLFSFSLKNGRVRVEPADMADAAQVILVDHAARRTMVLLPAREQFVEIPMPAEGTREQSGIQKTDQTDELLGFACDQFMLKSAEQEIEIWATKALGTAGTFLTNATLQTIEIPSWQTELLSLGYFPMKAIERDASGYEAAKFEVNSVQKKALGDHLFRVPRGYEKVDRDVLTPKQPAEKKRTR